MQMLPEFWMQKDEAGSVMTGARIPEVLKTISAEQTGIAMVNLRDFEKEYLELAATPTAKPLAVLMPCRAHLWKEKFPPVPDTRCTNADFPARDPYTGQISLKGGMILQLGRQRVGQAKGKPDVNLAKDGTIELILERDERWAPNKLWKEKADFHQEIKPELFKMALEMVRGFPDPVPHPRIYAAKPTKDTTKGRRVHQAMVRVPYNIAGYGPDGVEERGTAARAGKAGCFVREAQRFGIEKEETTGKVCCWRTVGFLGGLLDRTSLGARSSRDLDSDG